MTEAEVEQVRQELDHDIIDCRKCPYFQHAQRAPSEALTCCPTCGLNFFYKENVS
jgi:uracil-DNA glycosylase|tara:strand:+ start:193 stop:357 length:165 start_codon:yes stop_codon:yes gene_type:complete